MKSFVKYSVLGALSLGLVGLAVAGPVAAKSRHGERQGARFEKLDANADGFVTADEIEAARLARFTAQDADKDGFLSVEEIQASAMKRFEGRDHQPDAGELADRSHRMLRYMDENGDGKVAFAELPSHDSGKMITRFDADKDGKISKVEFDDAMAKFRMGHKGERHGEGYGEGRGKGHGPRPE